MGGCGSVGYYGQAVKGHWQIVARQTSCKKLLTDTNTPPAVRTQLELAQRLCDFARDELDLQAHGAYRRYADLQRPYVVWNVYATPPFSLEARTWWYPFVGSMDYRGYFSEQGARHYADKLASKGLDVYVEGVEAYSTLGWFNDPLLNTFLHHPEPILAEVLFHELAHQKVFAAGDTDFNEAFATVVAQAGVRRWLRANGETGGLARYEAALDRNRAFVRIVQRARGKLQQLYAVQTGTNAARLLQVRKQQVFVELRQDFEELRVTSEGFAGYAPWFEGDLNNAKLNSVATYYDLVPAFDQLLTSRGGELEPFYETVEQLTRLSEADRHEQLAAISQRLAEFR